MSELEALQSKAIQPYLDFYSDILEYANIAMFSSVVTVAGLFAYF